MKINGYKLREAVQKWELRRDTALMQFHDALWTFETGKEPGQLPLELSKQIVEAENAITKLQTAQLALNLQVKVEVQGKSITLCEAIKGCGGADRFVQMWKGVAKLTKPMGVDLYGRGDGLSRDKEKQYATRTVEPKVAVEYATKAGAYSVALRSAVSQGNGVEVDWKTLGVELSEEYFK
jgi:hypothetical protein